MRKLLLPLLFVAAFTCSYAQEQAEEVPDTLTGKGNTNEISIDIAPVFTLMGYEMSHTSFYLCFKKRMPGYAFRVSAATYNFLRSKEPERMLVFSDSSLAVHNYYTEETSGCLKFGFERYNINDLCRFYGGVDVVLGIGKRVSYDIRDLFEQENDTTFVENRPERKQEEQLSSTLYRAGFAPVVGIDLFINKHVSLGILIPCDLYYEYATYSNTTKTTGMLEFDTNLHLMLTVFF
ncbi:MAG: hypothetical protein KJ607_03705 [Bacteroidetes bacterium]|nr:hypothetical protein [Bacteroidota bacterium]